MPPTFSNPMHAPEAYEEYESHRESERDSLPVTPTTDAGRPISAAMHNTDGHTAAPRPKSRHSLFSRKSKRGTDIVQPVPVTPEQLSSREMGASSPGEGERDRYGGDGLLARGMIDNAFSGLSILPEVIPELPAWYNDNLEWIAASAIQFRARYPIHNPVGPKWYKNQHLIPPSERDVSMRPPSVFSPSFPPMTPAESEDRAAGPSRSPSGSPLPTPNSSQVRINEAGIRVRTRKTSQGAHDPVDLLDVSDPWGSHWHHESPYDVGMAPSPVSVDMPEGPPKSRSRMSSTPNTSARHRSVIPSPLSQSTSALHLHPPVPDVDRSVPPRRLSKRRRPGIRNFFIGGSHDDDDGNEPPAMVSAPVSPIDRPPPSSLVPTSGPRVTRKLSKRAKNATDPVISPSPTPSGKPPSISTQDTQKKRGSIFGALTKRFTVVRRHPNRRSLDDSHHKELSAEVAIGNTPERPFIQERRSSGLVKRVPPPSVDDIPPPADVPPPSEPPTRPEAPVKREDHGHSDRDSVLDAQFSMGRLTIANPDADIVSPARTEVPLPPEKDVPVQPHSLDRVLEQAKLVSEPEQLQEPQPVPVPAQLPPPREPRASLTNSNQVPPSPSVRKAPSPVAPEPAPAPVLVNMGKSPIPSRSVDTIPAASQSLPRAVAAPTVQSATRSLDKRREEAVQAPAPAIVPESRSPRTVRAQDEPLQPPPSLAAAASGTTDDSRLSQASIVGNPGTPHMPSSALPEVRAVPSVPAPAVPPVPSSSAAPPSADVVQSTPKREPSPPKAKEKSKKRETETFRLVRSPSGTVHNTSGVIAADGEMWEIVEAKDSPRRSRTHNRTRSSEQDPVVDRKTSSYQGHERTGSLEERPRKGESTERHKSSSGRHAVSPVAVAGPSNSQSRARSTDAHRRPAIPEQLLEQKEQRPQAEPKERHPSPEKRAVNGRHASQSPDVNRSHKRVSSNNDGTDVHRRPSRSGPRPTSDTASVEDFEKFRAREAWEMDRLYKGRSWDANGPKSAVSHEMGIAWPGTGKQGSVGRSHTVHSTGHGSSHTSVVVQGSFHAHGASTPAVYATATSPVYSHTSPHHPNGYRPRKVSIEFPSTSPNPLPDPPREADFQPTPLPPGLPDSPSSPEYWKKYAGLTAAH
ncbi:hypothetical protein OE88DRAFT_34622 [Heliocybe sulcata]|uniref:Uncharacterized protein n=1 Tax=Heliocybe sulcata TaxID=5364 RepID=A0A5C3NFQ5_9AGAM|nr:hypothetical protein OE88DRAFT_34622 [Heliocybe sulcata]